MFLNEQRTYKHMVLCGTEHQHSASNLVTILGRGSPNDFAEFVPLLTNSKILLHVPGKPA